MKRTLVAPTVAEVGRCTECGQSTLPTAAHICYAHAASASRMDEDHHKVDVANQRVARLGLQERFEVEIPCQPSEIRTNGAGKRETREIVDYRLNRPAIKLGEWQVAGHLEFLADARTHDDIPVGLCG